MHVPSQSRKSARHGQPAANTFARGLGWFSIGLGLAECLMPQTMARAVGLPGKEDLLRGFGLREIATGVGILSSKYPQPWIWGRVAGDVLDLGALSAGLHRDNPHRLGAVVAMLAVAHLTAIDVACATALEAGRGQQQRLFDYTDRSGFPGAPEQMRGAALSDFEMPADYRTPEALRPWQDKALMGADPYL